jgi:hypothetical protein
MAASHEGAQREVDPSGVSLVSFDASSGADGVVVLDTVINDDVAHRFQTYELDAEATYYGHRAIQEEQARVLATDRAAMAQQFRTGSEATS